jgi:N-acetyl-anhydromuramyl-L-alanine amidase AmpD
MRNITHLVVHHTATRGATTQLKGIDNAHKDRNWGSARRPIYATKSRLGYYAQYHYFIDWQGKLTQLRYDSEIGWHGNRSNSFSIGIAMAGWFDKGHDQEPSKSQVETLTKILRRLSKKYNIKPNNIVPHRKYANKSCYGNNLKDDWAQNLINREPITKLPHLERKKGSSSIYAYDKESDMLVAVADGSFVGGRTFKMLYGSYEQAKVKVVDELSREVSEVKITTKR